MYKVRGRIPIGAVVLSKVQDIKPDGKRVIQTEYILAERNGLRAITDKDEASKILGMQIVEYINRESVLPSTTSIVKTDSMGNFDLKLTASEYDVFFMSLTQKMLDSTRHQLVA